MKTVRKAFQLLVPFVITAVGAVSVDVAASKSAADADQFSLDDGSALVLVSKKVEMISYVNPAGERVTDWGVVYTYAPDNTRADATLSCTVDFSNSVPSLVTLPTIPITKKAFASSTLTVAAGCSSGVSWNHRLYRSSTARGTLYSAARSIGRGHPLLELLWDIGRILDQ